MFDRNLTIEALSFDNTLDEFGGIGKIRCKLKFSKLSHNTMADPGFVTMLLPLLPADGKSFQKLIDPKSKKEFEVKEEDGAIVTFLKLGPMTAGTLNALNAMGWQKVEDKGVSGEDFEDFTFGFSAEDMRMTKEVDVTLEVNTFTSGGKTYSNIRVKYINPVDLSIKAESAKPLTVTYKDLIKQSKQGPLKMEKKEKKEGASGGTGSASGGASGNVSGSSAASSGPPNRDASGNTEEKKFKMKADGSGPELDDSGNPIPDDGVPF